MQRLRVLIPLLALALRPAGGLAAQAPTEGAQAPPAAAAPGAAPASPAAAPAPPKPVAPGEPLAWAEPLEQVYPKAGRVSLEPRAGRPLALLFWGTWSKVSRDVLQDLDRFVARKDLLAKMDVHAVASFGTQRQKGVDQADMARFLGIEHVPVLADPDLALAKHLGVQEFPEIVLVDRDGLVVARQLRGLDHGRLSGEASRADELIELLAAKGTARPLVRTFPFYPGDRLLRHHYPDFELPLFSPAGWGKGDKARLSDLLSGQRPGVIMFFSSTCKHCQVDVPQIVRFLADHPGLFDVVGITRIKNETHRQVSAAYFAREGITFPVLEDVGGVADLYNVVSTPTTYYVAPNGNVVSTSYFQHPDLAADWTKLHAVAMGAPPPPPRAAESGWHFPLSVKDGTGKATDLASLEGEPLVLHFWATWCLPCRKELPDLVKRLPDLEKAGRVMLVTVEDDPAKVRDFQQSTGLSFPVYHSPQGGLAKSVDFGRSVPRTYVLDAHGNVEDVLAGSYEWADHERFTRVVGRLGGR